MRILCDWCKAEMEEIGHEYGAVYVYKCTKCHHEAGIVHNPEKLEDTPFMAARARMMKKASKRKLLFSVMDFVVLSAWIFDCYLMRNHSITIQVLCYTITILWAGLIVMRWFGIKWDEILAERFL
jgi:hypothetical protein